MQITTIIHSPDAPAEYDYPIDLPAGASMTQTAEGFVVIEDSAGDFIGGVAPAWATDANGTAVPTRYEIRENSLVQIVEHNDNFSYPIAADPWLGRNLIASAWVTIPKTGRYVVNVKPTSWGRVYSGFSTHTAHVNELKLKLHSFHAWRVDANKGTIREQFICHVFGNMFEPGDYNMESWRPSKHWMLQLNLDDQCNP